MTMHLRERTTVQPENIEAEGRGLGRTPVTLVGFFPGLGSRSHYRGVSNSILAGAPAHTLHLLEDAASALRDPVSVRELLLEGPLPSDRLRRAGRIGAGIVAANLALFSQLGHDLARRELEVRFAGVTGESFGVLSASIAAGGLSIADGIRIAEAFTPMMLLASSSDAVRARSDDPLVRDLASFLPSFSPGKFPVEEPMRVISLTAAPQHLEELLVDLDSHVSASDVEVHKVYSWRQANVYVRESFLDQFVDHISRFALVEAVEVKAPTTFVAHSRRMHVVRDGLSQWMDSWGMRFCDPQIAVVANHTSALLTTGEEVRDAVLSMADKMMDSAATSHHVAALRPDIVVEIGFGGRSLDLLTANGLEVPCAAVASGNDDVASALGTLQELRAVLDELRNDNGRLTPSHLDLLRRVLDPARSSLERACAHRELTDVASTLFDRGDRSEQIALKQFLEIFQNTLAHVGDVETSRGDLVVRARLKKRLAGNDARLGRASTELEVLHRDGGVDIVPLDRQGHDETVVISFENPHDSEAHETVRRAKTLASLRPEAGLIYGELSEAARSWRDAPYGSVAINTAVAFLAHRLALLELLHTNRPALTAQTDYVFAGTDRLGWLVSLVAAGAVGATSVLPLAAASLGWGNSTAQDQILRDLLREIQDCPVPILSPAGAPIRKAGELRESTQAVFCQMALDRPERLIQLNADCLVVSLGSRLAPYRVRSDPHAVRIVSVCDSTELWMRGLNPELDASDRRASLARSDERGSVVSYARERRVLSSTVNAYIEAGETIVGFGAGGSESLTMFFKRDGEGEIRVRKILSDALSAVAWDQGGTGVMLPPFAKAKCQAEYLMALPMSLRDVFPRVGRVTSRDVSIPTHLAADGSAVFKELIYEMSYIPGEEISRWVERTSPPTALVARIYEVVLAVLHQTVHTVHRRRSPGDTLDEQYFRKIEQRLELCRKTAPRTFGSALVDSDEIIINGQKLRNIRPLLSTFRGNPRFLSVLETRYHSLVMGDTNTENIKMKNIEPVEHARQAIEGGADATVVEAALKAISAESIGLTFLDPRAIGFESSGAETRDDPMYDNKPWHNSIGHYDELHNEQFDLKVEVIDGAPSVDVKFWDGNPYQRSYGVVDLAESRTPVTGGSGMESFFAPVMRAVYGLDESDSRQCREDPNWLVRFVFVMGTHFAAMPPFHFASEVDGSLVDTPDAQRRPVAIYAEGIKWLNWALEILEGSRVEFLGLPALPTADERGV